MNRQKTTADLLRVTSEILDGAKHLMSAGDDLNSGNAENDVLKQITLARELISMAWNQLGEVLDNPEVTNDD